MDNEIAANIFVDQTRESKRDYIFSTKGHDNAPHWSLIGSNFSSSRPVTGLSGNVDAGPESVGQLLENRQILERGERRLEIPRQQIDKEMIRPNHETGISDELTEISSLDTYIGTE